MTTSETRQIPNFYIYDLSNRDVLRGVGTIFLREDDHHAVFINGKEYGAFTPDEAQILEMEFNSRR